jgi:hypothetical protein
MTTKMGLSWLVFVVGLVGAAVSGVWAYRSVGLYGGPITSGFHREWNAETKSLQLIHETTTKAGVRIRRELSDFLDVKETELAIPATSDAVKVITLGTGRIPFSTRDDGVIDAWMTRDTAALTVRIEVSTKRNGQIDRWEHYAKGQLLRVDLDTNGNGKPDRWMTYEQGILMETFIDADENGKPDAAR